MCSVAGVCDTSTGQCICDLGRHGSDCSSKYFFLNYKTWNIFLIFVQIEFDCPADGSCSNQGLCDDTIGICICDQGFEGSSCQGKSRYMYLAKLFLNLRYSSLSFFLIR